MKKLVLVFVIGFVAAWQVKGNLTITPDNQVHFSGTTLPLPGGLGTLPIYGMVGAVIPSLQAPAPAGANGRAGTFPPLPAVAGGGGADPFAAAAKALR